MDSQSSRGWIQHVSSGCLFFLDVHCTTPHFFFSHKSMKKKKERKKKIRREHSSVSVSFGSRRWSNQKRVALACFPMESDAFFLVLLNSTVVGERGWGWELSRHRHSLLTAAVSKIDEKYFCILGKGIVRCFSQALMS